MHSVRRPPRSTGYDDNTSDEENGECWRIANLSQPNTPHFCRNCMLGFRDRILLNSHLKQHYMESQADHEEKAPAVVVEQEASYRCLNCKERFHSPEQLKIHCEACQPEDTVWQCDICEDVFDNKPLLDTHFINMHSEQAVREHDAVPCPHCALCFQNRDDLKIHIEIDHEMESPPKAYVKKKDEIYITVACECGKVFINELDYQEHILEEHPGTEPLKWPKDISEVKKRRRSEAVPRKRHIPHIPTETTYLPKRYKKQQRMVDPVLQRSYNSPNINDAGYYEGGCCVECGESFTKTVELKRHMQNEHQHLKPYACSICGRRFTRKSDVKRHIETIHGQAVSKEDLDRIQAIRPFRCAKCGNPFGRYMDIKKHIEMHHGIPFSPDTYVYQLEHMDEAGLAIGSSGEQVNVRTFDCGLCKRKYRNKTTVRHHIRKDHNQEDPDAFITRSHFNHPDDMECQFCGDVFNCIEDKIEHVQNIHQTIVEDEMGESVPLAGVIQQDIIQRNDDPDDCDNFMPVKDVSTPEKQRYANKNHIVILKQELVNAAAAPHPAPLELREDKKDGTWSSSLMNDIVSEQTKDKPLNYDCPECSRSFTRPRALQSHITKMHSQKHLEYECDLCGKSYKQQAQFVKHLQVAHPEVGPKAPVARKPDKTSKQAADAQSANCDICQQTFPSDMDLIVHMNTTHKGEPGQKDVPVVSSQAVAVGENQPLMEYYSCNVCGVLFSSTESLTRHMNMKHKNITVVGKKTVIPLPEEGEGEEEKENAAEEEIVQGLQDVSVEYS